VQARHRVLLAGFRVTDRALLEHLFRRDAERLDIGLYLHFRRGHNAWGFPCSSRDSNFEDSPQGCWSQFLRHIWPEGLVPPKGWYCPDIFEREDHANMHIKAAVVDGRKVFVSSANFTRAAQERNVELGVTFEDVGVAEGIERHFEGLRAS